MEEELMFNEDSEYYVLAERALDAYDLDTLFELLDLDPLYALVELQLAGVIELSPETLPEIFASDDNS